MKIALNLSTPPRGRERYALAWAVPAAMVVGVGLVILLVWAVRAVPKYRALHRSLMELQELEAPLRNRELTLRKDVERPQPREVFRRAQFVNNLIDKRQFSLTELTENVTKLLPPAVRLKGLALLQPGTEPVVRFTLVGSSEEAVETFLSNLEESSDFNYVAITNQDFEQGGSPGGPVTLSGTAQYLGGQRR